VVIASAGNRVKASGSSLKHGELETLQYVSSGHGRYLTEFLLYTTHEPCAMCASASGWARIGAVEFASRETTSPLMDESAGRKNTSDEPASFPADWSSRGTITLYQSSAVFYVTNVRNYSVTGLDRVSRPAVMNYFESERASDSTRILAVAWTAA